MYKILNCLKIEDNFINLSYFVSMKKSKESPLLYINMTNDTITLEYKTKSDRDIAFDKIYHRILKLESFYI